MWTDLILGRTRHARLLIMGRGPAASHPSVQRHAASRDGGLLSRGHGSRVTGQGRVSTAAAAGWCAQVTMVAAVGCGECGVLRPTVAPWSSLEVWPGRGEAASTSMTPDSGHRHHLWRTLPLPLQPLHWTVSGGCRVEGASHASVWPRCVWCWGLWGHRGTRGSLQPVAA